MLVGLAAPAVAFRLAKHGTPGARSSAIVWCVLGLADLAIAVTCGFLTAPSAFEQLALDAPDAAITSYPFVLIPTFAVPVAIALHVYVLARLDVRGRWAAVRA
ncbi:MAG: hypothetical protein ACR2KV_01780 [Solirubrobacteraceae bacterium]